MTLLNFSFLFGWCKVKFFLYFIFANGFHFPKLPFVLNFHSLLRHLHISEFAVLLFDCERYKLAAESIPQFFSKLRATVFFAAFFLKRKRALLRPPAAAATSVCRRSLSLRKSLILFITLSLVFKVKLRNFFHFFLKTY